MEFYIERELRKLEQQDLLEKSWFIKDRIVFKNRTDIIKYLQLHEMFNKKKVARVATYTFLNSNFFWRSAKETLRMVAHVADPENHEPVGWRLATYHPFIISFIDSYIDSFDSIEKAVDLMYSDGSAEKYQHLISDARKLTTDEARLNEFDSDLKSFRLQNLETFLNSLNGTCLYVIGYNWQKNYE